MTNGTVEENFYKSPSGSAGRAFVFLDATFSTEPMMTFEQFADLAQSSANIPVHRTMIADMLTPVAAYLRLRGSHRRSFLFESVEGGEQLGRFSFIGIDPEAVLSCRGAATTIDDGHGDRNVSGSFFEAIRGLIHDRRQTRLEGLPPFTGGLVGYIGYDMVRQIERLPDATGDPVGSKDAILGLFTTVIAFDHLHHQAVLIVNVRPRRSADLRRQYDAAQSALAGLERELLSAPPAIEPFSADADSVTAEMPKERFLENVRSAKTHIHEGDIFQVVLSQRFSSRFTGDPFQIYRALRVINPSPYLYFIDFGTVRLAGSSPEVLIRVQNGECEVFPIAGTRPRGASAGDDARREADLRADAKECAEHIMLVDLGRNDLGRVCVPGSVRVTDRMFLVKYSHVMHLASRVAGRLAPGKDCVDVVKAVFPAGTVSGAPKIRAMEIIDALEPTRRGIYAGGVGYIDFSGNIDMCIAIRMMAAMDSRLYFQAGAGIVADSDPEREFDETVSKARVIREAIRLARELPA